MKDLKFPVWGLTGGIASGKSTVGQFFEELGFPLIDADKISKKLSSEGGRAQSPILKRFGTIDRAKLKEIIFSDASARQDLENILHPMIRQEAIQEVQRIRDQGIKKPILYEAALLVEKGLANQLLGLIVVEAPIEERIDRMIDRDRIESAQARRIILAQTSDETRRKAATHIIVNNGSLDKLKQAVHAVAAKLTAD